MLANTVASLRLKNEELLIEVARLRDALELHTNRAASESHEGREHRMESIKHAEEAAEAKELAAHAQKNADDTKLQLDVIRYNAGRVQSAITNQHARELHAQGAMEGKKAGDAKAEK